jgi:hypothetical protein
MKISSLTMDHLPPLLLMNVVVTVTVVLSRQLTLCLKKHQHRLIRPRRNGGSPRLTMCGCSWWWCLSFWLEGMVSFVW